MPEPKTPTKAVAEENKSLTVEQMWSQQKTLDFIKSQVAPTLNDQEFALFVGIGRNTGTNPLLREIWAIKYGNKCSIFIGRDGYRKAAQKHPKYDSHSSFSVYENDTLTFSSDGTPKLEMNLKNRGNLIGAIAWCKRKGSTMSNCGGLVLLKEYNTKMSNWSKMPDTMIKKVAEAQILRQTFQELFAGTYDESEQGAFEGKPVISGTVETAHVPDITILLHDISKIDSLEKLVKLQSEELPSWGNSYSGEDLDKIAFAMKTRRDELEKSGGDASAPVSPTEPILASEEPLAKPKKGGEPLLGDSVSQPKDECPEVEPPTESKEDTAQMIENTLGDGKDLKGKGFEKEEKPVKAAPKPKVEKKEAKLKVEEVEEKKPLAEAAEELFDDEKITKADAEKFRKFFEAKKLDYKPWLGRCCAEHFIDLTVSGAKELSRIIHEEILKDVVAEVKEETKKL